jgi:hypothetical protein
MQSSEVKNEKDVIPSSVKPYGSFCMQLFRKIFVQSRNFPRISRKRRKQCMTRFPLLTLIVHLSLLVGRGRLQKRGPLLGPIFSGFLILFACVDFSYSQTSTSIWDSNCGHTEANAQYADYCKSIYSSSSGSETGNSSSGDAISSSEVSYESSSSGSEETEASSSSNDESSSSSGDQCPEEFYLQDNEVRKMNEEISLTGEHYVYIPIELFQEKKSSEEDSAVELCISYVDENDFELHGLKNIKLLPDPDWIYPDSIECENDRFCSNSWETVFNVIFPNNDTSHGFSDGIKFSGFAKKKEIRHIAPMDEIELPQHKLFSKDKMSHAQEYWRKHYGEKLRGITTTGIDSYDKIKLKLEVDVKLVGECGPLVINEYCISEKNGLELLRTQFVDFLPVTKFARKDMKCGKDYKVIKRLELDFGVYGKKTMGPYTESRVCNKTRIIGSAIQMPRYKTIDLSNMASMRQKDLSPLYGKTVPVKWDAELQYDSSTIEKSGEYLIRIKGKCSEDEENPQHYGIH